jgi:hypothetical protein
MARLYTIEKAEVPKDCRWGSVLRIRMEPSSIPDYGELDRYARFNFKHNYFLTAHMTQHIAGGSSNNEIHCPDRPITVEYYELRCHEDDAKRFLVIWEIPAREYAANKAYQQELDGRKSGWVKVGGKTVPLHEVVRLVEELPKPKLRSLFAKAYK